MKNFIKKHQLALELLFLLSWGIIPLLWYGPGEMGIGHDMGFPLAPIDHFQDRLFVWTERVGSFGSNQAESVNGFFIHGLEAFLSWIGLSLINAQKTTFIFWLLAPGVSMYILLRSLQPKKEYWLYRLSGSLFYMMNHFFLQAWFIAERTKFSAATALPLLILLTINALYREKSILKNGLLFGLVLLFFNAGPGIPLYAGLATAIGVTAGYFTIKDINRKNALGKIFKLIKFGLIALVTTLVLNLYWIVPLYLYTIGNFSTRLGQAGGVEGAINWSHEISKNSSFMNLFRLQGIPDWYNNLQHPYSNNILSNPIFVLLSFIWPVIAFCSLIFVKKRDSVGSVFIPCFIILALIGIFFAAGSHPPTGVMYDFLLRTVPGFSVMRTPFYKFGMVIWFSYAVLIGWGMQYIYLYLKKLKYVKLGKMLAYLLFPVFILAFSVYNYPYFTGVFFNWSYNYSTMLKVPKHVFDFKEWIDDLNGSSDRVLLVPGVDPNTKYEITDWGYFSLSTLPTILTNNSVVINDAYSKQMEEVLVNSIYDNLLDNNGFSLAQYLGIGHILVRKDSNAPNNANYFKEDIVNAIENSSDFRKLDSFGKWDLYSIENYEKTPLIYLSTDNTYLDTPLASLATALSIPEISYGNSFIIPGLQPVPYSHEFPSDTLVIKARCISCLLDKKNSVHTSPVRKFAQSRLVYYLETFLDRKKAEGIINIEQHIDYLLGNILKKEALVTKIQESSKDGFLITSIYADIYSDLETIVTLQNNIESPERQKYYAERVYLYIDYLQGRLQNAVDTFEHDPGNRHLSSLAKDLRWQLLALDFIPPEDIATIENLYQFEVPREGNYHIIINQQPEFTNTLEGKLQLENANKIVNSTIDRRSDEWVDLGSINLSKGSQQMVIPIPKSLPLGNLAKEFSVDSPRGEYMCNNLNFPVSPKLTYDISFDYRTEIGEPIYVKLIQDSDLFDSEKRPFHVVDGLLLKDASWRGFDFELKPHKYTRVAELEFCINSNEKEESSVKIDNFQVLAKSDPGIYLVSDSTTTTPDDIPQISFKKIDQTKYIISTNVVSDGPYILNFNQRFDRDWKLTEIELPENALDDAKIVFSNSFGKEYESEPNIEYSIVDDQGSNNYSNFMNNGYNNAWVIDGGAKNYLLEYTQQSVFLKSAAISLLGLIVTTVTLLVVKIKERKTRNDKE